MSDDFAFSITTTRFDEDYSPSENSRTTTNFANLARGEHRRQNLRRALAMIDDRFNGLAGRHDPSRDRYTVELEIVSADLQFTSAGESQRFPLIEVLDVQILDRDTGERHPGIVGNNFSSYVRDYDFSVLLPAANENTAEFTVPDDFGDFWRDFEWMGLQRHLKVLGIFARLSIRDGKPQYLGDIPRVWTFAHRVASRYQGLGPLARLLEQAEAAHGGIQTQVGYTF